MRLYIKLGKRVGLSIRQLGYPTKNALKSWHREYEQRLDLLAGHVRQPRYSQAHKERAVEHRVDGTGHDELAAQGGASRSAIERDLQRAQAAVQLAIEHWQGPGTGRRNDEAPTGRRSSLSALLGLAGLRRNQAIVSASVKMSAGMRGQQMHGQEPMCQTKLGVFEDRTGDQAASVPARRAPKAQQTLASERRVSSANASRADKPAGHRRVINVCAQWPSLPYRPMKSAIDSPRSNCILLIAMAHLLSRRLQLGSPLAQVLSLCRLG